MDIGVTRRDLLRFIYVYDDAPWSPEQRRFWADVDRTARRLYRRIHGRDPEPVR